MPENETTTSAPCSKCKPCLECGDNCPCKQEDPSKPIPKPECLCVNCKETCHCSNLKSMPKLNVPESKCPSNCKCPKEGTDTTSQCLDDIVAKQDGDAGAKEKEKLKADLTKIVDAAKKARQAYTREKYDEYKKRWKFQNGEIVKLLHKFECSVCCWACVLECHINPLLNELNRAELMLHDSGKLIGEINDLLDKQYYVTRYIQGKNRTADRILRVIKAWESPATSIDKALNDNDKLIADISKQMGLQPGKVIYDIFITLIPRHMAIAPETEKNNIPSKYIDIFKCKCNFGAGAKDECCDVNTGQLGFLERLVSPQASLIDPDNYFDLICCLIKCRYEPVANILIEANIELQKINNEIERNLKIVGPSWPAEFEKNARAAIPSEVDCIKYPHNPDKKDPCASDEPKKKDEQPERPKDKGDCGDGNSPAQAAKVQNEGGGDADNN